MDVFIFDHGYDLLLWLIELIECAGPSTTKNVDYTASAAVLLQIFLKRKIHQ